MGIFDRIRPKARVEVALVPLRAAVRSAAVALGGAAVSEPLVLARLADRVREARGEPLHPDLVARQAAALDADGWRRLVVTHAALAAMPLEAMVAGGCAVQSACVAVSAQNPLLTIPLLAATPLRCEELARKLAAQVGVAIAGEDEAVSRAQVERLDYARLLAEGERAAKDAEARLKAIEEKRAQQGPRRGKW